MSNKVNIPFIEKYRPKNIDDIVLPVPIQYKIKNIIETNTMPNMIITGPYGIGKTSTLICLVKKILGKKYNEMVLELNASNNRTLEFINTTVASFCKKKIIDDTKHHKVIILDEADNITKKAQNLLSNLMEEYAMTTKFAFTCNDSTKIIESIQSRCSILRYTTAQPVDIKKRLHMICEKEKIKYDNRGIDSIIFISQGDMRQAINNLEATYLGYNDITEENVYKVCYHPHPKIIVEIIKEAVMKNLNGCIKQIHELRNKGYCNSDILLTMLSTLREINIDEDIRINFIKIISNSYICVSDGIDTNLQMYGCLSEMIKYIRVGY